MSRRWSPTRIVIVCTVTVLVGMWVYVLYLAFGPGRQPPADRLEDSAFAEAGESVCADAVAKVEALPMANEEATAAERGAVLGDANSLYASMLDELEVKVTLAPEADDQRERVEEWLDDWRVLLNDRQDYAEALRSDANARLLISEKDDTGRHITGWIDEFAKANRMPSCSTPADV